MLSRRNFLKGLLAAVASFWVKPDKAEYQRQGRDLDAWTWYGPDPWTWPEQGVSNSWGDSIISLRPGLSHVDISGCVTENSHSHGILWVSREGLDPRIGTALETFPDGTAMVALGNLDLP